MTGKKIGSKPDQKFFGERPIVKNIVKLILGDNRIAAKTVKNLGESRIGKVIAKDILIDNPSKNYHIGKFWAGSVTATLVH